MTTHPHDRAGDRDGHDPSRGLTDAEVGELAAGTARQVLVRGAAVLTQDPTTGDLPVGDVLVQGGRIVAVGPDLAATTSPDAVVIDGRDRIAIPGFVDAHVHAWEGLLRGVAPTADFGAYLGVTAFGAGPRHTPDQVYAGTLATALAALDAGTTTLVDNAHNALTPDHARAGVRALLDAGMRGIHAVGSPFGSDLEHVRGTAVALRDEHPDGLVSVRLFEVNPSVDLWRFARDAGLWVSTETGGHTPDVDGLLRELARLGLFTSEHALNHCYDLADATWDVIADSGAAVNLAPRSDAAFGLGSTVLAVEACLSRGVPTGISGDNEVSYGLSMFADMADLRSRSRSEAFRRRTLDPESTARVLTPAELLHAATTGGAANAGLLDQVGSLTPGKRADLVLLDRTAPALAGVADPVTAVTAFAHPGVVDVVMVDGRLRKHAGRLVGLDLPAARALVDRERAALDGAVTDRSAQVGGDRTGGDG